MEEMLMKEFSHRREVLRDELVEDEILSIRSESAVNCDNPVSVNNFPTARLLTTKRRHREGDR